MKYLYPFECENLKLSTPSELQAAIDGNRREARRPTYSFEYPSLNNSQSFPGQGIGFNHPVNSVNSTMGLMPSRLFPPIFHSNTSVPMNTPFDAASMLAAAFQRHQQINTCFPHITPPFLNFSAQSKNKIENLKIEVENIIDQQNRLPTSTLQVYCMIFINNFSVKSFNNDLSHDSIHKEPFVKQSYSPELIENSNQTIPSKSFISPQMSTDYQADSNQIFANISDNNNLQQKVSTQQNQKIMSNFAVNVCASSNSSTNHEFNIGKITNIPGNDSSNIHQMLL